MLIGVLRWANVSLLIGPLLALYVGLTLVQHVGSKLAQRSTPTLAQRWPNVVMLAVSTLLSGADTEIFQKEGDRGKVWVAV